MYHWISPSAGGPLLAEVSFSYTMKPVSCSDQSCCPVVDLWPPTSLWRKGTYDEINNSIGIVVTVPFESKIRLAAPQSSCMVFIRGELSPALSSFVCIPTNKQTTQRILQSQLSPPPSAQLWESEKKEKQVFLSR